jgi:hypothetical protein
MTQPTKIRATFFRSKVAQRIVILFVSLRDVTRDNLAGVAFYQVSSQLHEDSERQLMRASKNQAMAIYERLELLDSDVQLLTAQLGERRSPVVNRVLRDRFESVAVFGPDGSTHSLWGNSFGSPQLSQAEIEHLQSGGPLIKVASCKGGDGPCITMMRMTDQGFTVAGVPNGDFLWALKNVPAGFEFCVLSSSGVVLTCTEDRVSSAVSQHSLTTLPDFGDGAAAILNTTPRSGNF